MHNTSVIKNNRNNPLSTAALYDLAAERNIPVVPFDLQLTPSMSIMDERGQCAVAMAKSLQGAREHTCLGHEMGHCVTGSFYTQYTSGAVRGKSEYKANKWAYYHLVPPLALRDAMNSGITQPWQLAEHFSVTEDFILDALDYYACVQPLR